MPYGEEGVLVFTTLTKEAMPLLRYWTNDICSLHYDSDAKRTHVKMSSIRGRADNMLIVRGVNLFHTQVEELLPYFPELSPNYQLIVSREGTMDELNLDVEISKDISNKIGGDNFSEKDIVVRLAGDLKKKIKNNVGLSMKVNIRQHGEIPRSEGGKLSRVKDLRRL